MLGDGGWEEQCLKLYPNPEMPEKAPRATSSFEVGRFPQPPLACADQAWPEAGATPFPHTALLGSLDWCRGPSSLHHPTYIRRKESGLLASPFLSQRRDYRVWTCPQQGWLQKLWQPFRPNKGNSFPFNFGNAVFLFIPF